MYVYICMYIYIYIYIYIHIYIYIVLLLSRCLFHYISCRLNDLTVVNSLTYFIRTRT